MLQGLKAGGRGNVTRTVTAVEVQQRVVAFLDVPRQPQHLLRVLHCGSRLVDLLEQAGSVLDEGADVLLVDVSKLFRAISAPTEF